MKAVFYKTGEASLAPAAWDFVGASVAPTIEHFVVLTPELCGRGSLEHTKDRL